MVAFETGVSGRSTCIRAWDAHWRCHELRRLNSALRADFDTTLTECTSEIPIRTRSVTGDGAFHIWLITSTWCPWSPTSARVATKLSGR